jgi:hypothetical protein
MTMWTYTWNHWSVIQGTLEDGMRDWSMHGVGVLTSPIQTEDNYDES